ncbi:hypothetical protein SDRG_00106 [Saprolegnia diclina VS20]|uniref:Kinesin motor domain-containing protein n=1 Tax=Saprolegnia diclina (strain VS20) TaxID=1156394 RepID=T0SAK6_SAPDV|nr:hypothetical protein SDRG_00106 [Saprolegnia diclina VS20]EQC42368.1 hypothetical protein SDRG_00106 [Saprolegnia diclina VS20]|eukprot:XP_008603791.1 hypothetical protein SDRG_00106 [Saprolegnia diclina VS20]
MAHLRSGMDVAPPSPRWKANKLLSPSRLPKPTSVVVVPRDRVPALASDIERKLERQASCLADAPPLGETIRCMVRIRPSASDRRCVDVDLPTQSVSVNMHMLKTDRRRYAVDGVFPEAATQEEIFLKVGLPVVATVLLGFHGCVLAYGQTGSGKTHTMQGDMDPSSDERGLIPRVVQQLFASLSASQTPFTCHCSYFEIYNEKIFDLLDTSATEPKAVREDNTGVYVQDILESHVTTPEDALRLLHLGTKQRTVGSTAMNRESSRSHSVFTLHLTQTLPTADGLSVVRRSLLHLVDLAGSEKQSHTRAFGLRLKEASQINKSLSVLGNVITALVDVSRGVKRHVNYRDSKLTFLLRDALGGNSKTTLLATIAPDEAFTTETLSTLQFVQRAKCITTAAVANEDTGNTLAVLQRDLADARSKLARLDAEHTATEREMSCRLDALLSDKFALKSDNARLQRSAAAASEEVARWRLASEDNGRTAHETHDPCETEGSSKQDATCRLPLENEQLRMALEEAATHRVSLVAVARSEAHGHDVVVSQLQARLQARDVAYEELERELAAARHRLASSEATAAAERERQNDALREQTAAASALHNQLQLLQSRPSTCHRIQEESVPFVPSPRRHRRSESDVSEDIRLAVTSFNAASRPSTLENAVADLQLQHQQMLHLLQKLDSLRQSKKFLEHALQNALADNAELIASANTLQRERDAARASTAAAERYRLELERDKTLARTASAPAITTTLHGFSKLDVADQIKTLAADKVALSARLKTAYAKVQSLEESLQQLRTSDPCTRVLRKRC